MNTTAPERSPQRPKASFFAFHGPWAPGVRLFRRLNFQAKALLVSLCFLLPLGLLLVAYVQGVQSDLGGARQERGGVEMLRKVQPWLAVIQRERRLVLTGEAAKPDMAAVDAAFSAVRQVVDARPGDVDATAPLAQAMSAHATLTSAVAAHSGTELAESLQAYVDAANAMRTEILDGSQLSLDPQQATYYLVMAGDAHANDIVESISHSRALAGLAQSRGATPSDLRDVHDLWHDGQEAMDSLRDAVKRAGSAAPELAAALPLEDVLAKARAFYAASAGAWFGDSFDAATGVLDAPGQAAVDALQSFSKRAADKLDELLAAREGTIKRQRNLTLGIVVASLLAVLYLFHSFFLVMRGGLSEVERHLKAMTAGDLTTTPRPWGRDEAANLMNTLASMQLSLRGIVTEVRSASDGLVQASDEIASASDDLSRRSEQAAANLEESASAMEQISTTVQQASETTKAVSTLAGENAEVAELGGRTIRDVVETMREVQASSARISDIIGVIDGIAFQTNILALNAAVEAARAGEQGRGFAVVAAEVRALAQRSAGAAREVKTLITDSVERVGAGSRVVGEAGQQMSAIVANAGRMRGLMEEILVSTQEQSAGVRQVGGSIQTLDQQTQQNAALVEQTAAAASSLHDQANALAQRVAQFRLPAAAAA